MDAKYFCDAMSSELTGLKARIYNVIREMDRMPQDQKEAAASGLAEMNGLVDDLKSRIDELNNECPADWGAQREEIESIKSNLTDKINLWDAEHIAGGYVGG